LSPTGKRGKFISLRFQKSDELLIKKKIGQNEGERKPDGKGPRISPTPRRGGDVKVGFFGGEGLVLKKGSWGRGARRYLC